ncbi:MAG TPA: hypothetical protein VFF29_07740, partial [Bacteroidota bacterium]|nr:hypothetical protein [Bacteroidota bacterium]
LEVVKGHDGLFIAEPGEPSSFAEKILEMMAYAQNTPTHSPDAAKFSSISWSRSARRFEKVSLSIFNAEGITD